MSKERFQQILDEFREDYHCLCYQYDKELNRFHLYENSNKVAEFFLDNYALVMSDETDTSVHPNKAIRLANTKYAIRVAIAKYIVQEEELRYKEFKYKVPKFFRSLTTGSCLNYNGDKEYFFVSNSISVPNENIAYFTDEQIDYLIEKHGDDFKTFIDMCEKLEVQEE